MDPILSMPMTQVELLLKQSAAPHPELKNRILSLEELTEYCVTMAKSYKNSAELGLDFLNNQLQGIESESSLAELTRSMFAQGENIKFFHSFSDIYQNTSEEQLLIAEHDISVGRMLRYMPANWHSDDFFQIYFTASRNCCIYFKDEIISMRPGTIVVIAPNVLHGTPCFADDAVLLNYRIRSSTFDRVFWNQLPSESLLSNFFRKALDNTDSTGYLHFETGDDPEIRQILTRMYEEAHTRSTYRSQMLNALMSTFWVLLLQRYEGTARLPRTSGFHWKHEFSAIFSFIQTNYATTSLPELAQHFHYSERQISRIVQTFTGQSYAQLILKLRMERALTLLKQRRLSVEAIALQVGYSSASSFYRAFVKYYGCAPTHHIESM